MRKDALLKATCCDEKERAACVGSLAKTTWDGCRVWNVKVTQFMEVQNYSHVMHIVSMVEEEKGEYHPFDLAHPSFRQELKWSTEDCDGDYR